MTNTCPILNSYVDEHGTNQTIPMLNCEVCKKNSIVQHLIPDRCFPVYSFGSPVGKKLFIVGLNPSEREYVENHLSSSPDWRIRKKSQFNYFKRRYYDYFRMIEVLFTEESMSILKCKKSIWPKVAYLDLVKCVTRKGHGQWSDLSSQEKQVFVDNCKYHLFRQLELYKPRLVIAYGRDVKYWFERLGPLKLNTWIYVPQVRYLTRAKIASLQFGILEALTKYYVTRTFPTDI